MSTNKSISYLLCNKDIIINLYKLHFLSSHFPFQSNKIVFHPSTFPFLQPNTHEEKLNIFYLPTFSLPHSYRPQVNVWSQVNSLQVAWLHSLIEPSHKWARSLRCKEYSPHQLSLIFSGPFVYSWAQFKPIETIRFVKLCHINMNYNDKVLEGLTWHIHNLF